MLHNVAIFALQCQQITYHKHLHSRTLKNKNTFSSFARPSFFHWKWFPHSGYYREPSKYSGNEMSLRHRPLFPTCLYHVPFTRLLLKLFNWDFTALFDYFIQRNWSQIITGWIIKQLLSNWKGLRCSNFSCSLRLLREDRSIHFLEEDFTTP